MQRHVALDVAASSPSGGKQGYFETFGMRTSRHAPMPKDDLPPDGMTKLVIAVAALILCREQSLRD